MSREDGKGFTVSSKEIAENDFCLSPQHYMKPPRCPYHHKDQIELDKIKDKLATLKIEKETLREKINNLESSLNGK